MWLWNYKCCVRWLMGCVASFTFILGIFWYWNTIAYIFCTTASIKFGCMFDACLMVLPILQYMSSTSFENLCKTLSWMCNWRRYHLLMSPWSIQHLNLTLNVSPGISCLETKQSKAAPEVSIRISFATSLERIIIIPQIRLAVYYTSSLVRNFDLVLIEYDKGHFRTSLRKLMTNNILRS